MLFFTRWRRLRSARSRQRILAAAERAEESERDLARRRLLDTGRRNAGPTWNAPTQPLPTRNQITSTGGKPAAARRSKQPGSS